MRLSFLVLVPMLSGCIAYVTRMGGDANGGEFRLEAEDSYALRLGIRAALDEIGKECQGEYEITSVDLRPVASLRSFFVTPNGVVGQGALGTWLIYSCGPAAEGELRRILADVADGVRLDPTGRRVVFDPVQQRKSECRGVAELGCISGPCPTDC